ncbi:hypothetical protein P168DRAFT_59642 [Aspergillus campestris IBT 28561]|uniref:Uncharacterized protein n=1 Tax=Aspergillus campestris (strain IBT 28561) TaxID=1392248 RepID=A0A2I1CU72_ASPC2|nr:uncharacterized protein P168DRAFT_59642 [Aspergillus campestris IBT 28561]PKY01165.1 hypothetical protein P168DRAFT_59642 [Aspergillus campestris IBT 28561]
MRRREIDFREGWRACWPSGSSFCGHVSIMGGCISQIILPSRLYSITNCRVGTYTSVNKPSSVHSTIQLI